MWRDSQSTHQHCHSGVNPAAPCSPSAIEVVCTSCANSKTCLHRVTRIVFEYAQLVQTTSIVLGEHGAEAHHTMQGRLQMLKHMVYTRRDLVVTPPQHLAAQTKLHNGSTTATDKKTSV